MTYRFWHVGINVTDMDRTIAFYEKIGFQLEDQGGFTNPQVGEAFFVEGGDTVRFAHMRLNPNEPNESMLDLIQWIRRTPLDARSGPVSILDPVRRLRRTIRDAVGPRRRVRQTPDDGDGARWNPRLEDPLRDRS